MHPDAVALYTDLRTLQAQLIDVKQRTEYVLQKIAAKGLLPDEEGNAPEALAVVGGVIGGDPNDRKSNLLWEPAALSIRGMLALQAANQVEIVPGVTIENAILGNAAA